eukprot:superscaffoldBa00004255_g18541
MDDSTKPLCYELLAEVGEGSYGKVYKAREVGEKQRLLAVKKFNIRGDTSETGIPAFMIREVALLRKMKYFNHPNIIKLLDASAVPVGQSLDLTLVLEYIDQDLSTYLSKVPASGLNQDCIKDVMLQLLRGLDFLHTNMVLHRDLKPENILVSSHGEIKIADFGLARIYTFNIALTPGWKELDVSSLLEGVIGLPSDEEWPKDSPVSYSVNWGPKGPCTKLLPNLGPDENDLLSRRVSGEGTAGLRKGSGALMPTSPGAQCMDMDAMENPVLEPRSERIARYKAERRRELAERFGNMEELPSKWVRRDGKEVHDPATQPHKEMSNSEGTMSLSERINGRTRKVTNGLEAETSAESDYLRRQGSRDSASMLSGEGHLVPHGLDAPQLHTRVSVGQLRSALLQQTGSGAQPEKVCSDAGRATSSLDLAVKPGPEGGRRRTRRYLPGGSGGGRKTSERFRTQPITANEMEESSGLLDEEEEENSKADVKTDDRAKMSVAAKMSLFKELEKSAAPEASDFLKPRSGSVSHERRVRRGNEHRFLTQPITCEEMVAISAPTPNPAPPVEAQSEQSEQAESAEDGDENCKLSMSEKLALFNKLSLPGRQGGGHTDGPPERRRQKGARYRTQPITVEEVSLLQKGPVQLPAFCLSPHLSDRQQASSVNLKPSEVRLSQPRPDTGPGPGEPSPTQQGLQRYDSEPGLRGILKKSRSGGPEWSMTESSKMDAPFSHEQNGGGCGEAEIQERMEGSERQEISAAPRRERREASGVEGGSLTAAPWRQRARARRETIACTPIRASSEQDAPKEERSCRVKTEEQPVSSVEHSSDLTGRVQQDEEQESAWMRNEETTKSTGHVQVTLMDGTTKLHETTNSSSNKEETETSQVESIDLQCWTSLSFEAQEVCSPTKNQNQPQWRQKAKEVEDEQPQMVETEETNTQQEMKEQETECMAKRSLGSPESDRNDASHSKRHFTEATDDEISVHPVMEFEAAPQSAPLSVETQEVKEVTPADESNTYDGGLDSEQSPPSTCAPPPCGDAAATENEQDLDVLCQTNTH